MRKKLCVLQVTPESPNVEHVSFFRDKEDCDFFFVTHDAPHKDALEFCPNTTWTDTRNILADKVPKNYDYYAFVDYDYEFVPLREKEPLDQILEDLNEKNPAVLTYYPGPVGLHTPYARDLNYRNSKDYSVIPFTHCGMKVVHHSLMDWFFPMITKFGGGFSSCHLFNIQEIPFLKNVVTSHKMVYNNSVSDSESEHNKNVRISSENMEKMWAWIMPSFKRMEIVERFSKNPRDKYNSLTIKEAFMSLMRVKDVNPEKSDIDNFFDSSKIESVFDLNHKYFREKNVSRNTHQGEKHVNFHFPSSNELRSSQNPWIQKSLASDCTELELVEEFQKTKDRDSFFINSSKKNKDFADFIEGKRVAYVGPAPYLMGSGNGKRIDDYDVVVRIQGPIFNQEDYGSKTDIIQSCLNFNYGPALEKLLDNTPKSLYPKFIMCNDTVAGYLGDKWVYVRDLYEQRFSKFDIPLVDLQRDDGTSDRWHLYWEVYPKYHIEYFQNGVVENTENFNSGYGAIAMLSRYDLKELYVTGIDFYNMGTPQEAKEKYNPEYISNFGKEGTPYGPDKKLHDQLSQIMHFKNVIMPNRKNITLDEHLSKKLSSQELDERLELYKKLKRTKNETR